MKFLHINFGSKFSIFFETKTEKNGQILSKYPDKILPLLDKINLKAKNYEHRR